MARAPAWRIAHATYLTDRLVVFVDSANQLVDAIEIDVLAD